MSTPSRIDINTFLDNKPLSKTQWYIFTLCFLILVFDGFDTVVIGFVAPALIDDWGISRQALGPVMMSGMLGLAVGAVVAGPLADRFGRKSVIMVSVFCFGFWSLVSAFSTDITTLTLYRFLTGAGLGASMPNTATLAAEFSPKRLRSFVITCTYCGFNIGGALGGVVCEQLIVHWGWHAVFVVGGVVPMAFAVLCLPFLPESLRYMIQFKKFQAKILAAVRKILPEPVADNTEFHTTEVRVESSSAVSALFTPGYKIGTLMLWLTLFNTLLTVYLLASWLPLIIRDAGMTLLEAAIILIMFNVGGMVGNFSMGWLMDRIEHHFIIRVQVALSAVVLVCLASVPQNMAYLCPIVFFLGTTVNSQTAAVYALSTHFYPTQMRSTGTSWSAGIGRLGAVAGSGVGALFLAANMTSAQIFLALTVPVAVAFIALSIKKHYAVPEA